MRKLSEILLSGVMISLAFTLKADALSPGDIIEKMMNEQIKNIENTSHTKTLLPESAPLNKSIPSSSASFPGQTTAISSAIEDIKKVSENIKSYESEISVEVNEGEGEEDLKSLTLYLKEKRIYTGKDVESAHLFIQTNNEKDEMTTADYIVREGKIYQFDGSSYNLMGPVGSYDFNTDTNYWNMIKPLLENPSDFRESLKDDDLIFSIKGNSRKVNELLAVPLGFPEGSEFTSLGGDIIYTLDRNSFLLKSIVAELEGNGINAEIKAFYQNINMVDSIELPEDVEIKE